MRLPFIGKVELPVPDQNRDHDGAALAQMIAADAPRREAYRRATQAARAEEAKRQRAEDRRVAALLAEQGYEGD